MDPLFPANHPGHLGACNREPLFSQLNQDVNLVLLSDRDAHPCVCCEPLIAGLGLVVSEQAAANLDLSLPFILVMPDAGLSNRSDVARAIRHNHEQCQQVGSNVIRACGLRAFAMSIWVERYPSL